MGGGGERDEERAQSRPTPERRQSESEESVHLTGGN
jgi:hypothetical protein